MLLLPQWLLNKVHRKCRIASAAKNFYRCRVKHSGKAVLSGLKLIAIALVGVIVLLLVSWLAAHVGAFIVEFYGVLFCLWVLFALFTLYFFRDPDPLTPTGANLVVSPAHGKRYSGGPEGFSFVTAR